MPPKFPGKLGLLATALIALSSTTVRAADALDDLSLEDLTQTEITSVSRKSQSLSNVPAAAFVISAEEIRRSGATVLPDVLRMVPGIEVAQVDNGRYAVSARGFNGRFANKLQVLVDGRSIYNPMFSGVMWETDPVALEDIERIEVIRGPGAAVWGVNAVNGVINIISKHSRTQTGGFIAPALGTQGTGNLYARYGAAVDADTTWKMSFQGRHAEPSRQAGNGEESEDRLNNAKLDFRFDRNLGSGSDLAIWANASESSLGDLARLEPSTSYPLQVLPKTLMQKETQQLIASRYRWLTDSGIESSLQISAESSSIEMVKYLTIDRKTVDLDYQGRYTFASHDLLWGLSHRSSSDDVRSGPTNVVFSIRNPSVTQRTSGLFLQDDWTLIPEKLQLGLGARWDNTNLGGSTFAPNATLMWTPSKKDSVWLKYAKAPRMPARAEQDASVLIGVIPPRAPGYPAVVIRNTPGDDLHAETMQSLELGYRTQLTTNFNVNVNTYRQRYSDIVSGKLGAIDTSTLFPLAVIQDVSPCNCASGWINGTELAADWLVLPSWRLQFSYTWTSIQMDAGGSPVAQASIKDTERQTPRHYGSLRSQWNISSTQQLDAWIRGSAGFERPNAPFYNNLRVPGYVTLDLRYAQKITKDIEIALSGRNLIGGPRNEVIADYIPSVPVEIRPSLLLTTRWTF